jgi:hypothetical protein
MAGRDRIQFLARSRLQAEAEDLRATEMELTADRVEERAEQGRTELEERLRQAVKDLPAETQSAQQGEAAAVRQPSEQTGLAVNRERAGMVERRTYLGLAQHTAAAEDAAFLVIRDLPEPADRAEAEPEGKQPLEETEPRTSEQAEEEAIKATADLWGAEERAGCDAPLQGPAGRVV